VDIFADVVREHRRTLLNAVIRAASQLGVFRLFQGDTSTRAYSAAEIATRLNLPTCRLSRLLDILVAEGILCRVSDGDRDRLWLPAQPSSDDLPAGDWDRIADVIAADRSLDLNPAWLEGHLTYVAQKSERVAPLLWQRLEPRPGGWLLDIGGGLGAYSISFLNNHQANSATLLDLPEVLSLVEKNATGPNARLTTCAGDARNPLFENEYDVVLLANVLHLFGPEDCRTIVRNAVSAAKPGGVVVIWDLVLSPDRGGPLVCLYFALNMAIYTEAGDVYTFAELAEWMSDTGLEKVAELLVPECPHSVGLVGTRGQA
jgi:2-polyprenyl-3-methyl-5-hydroxy-6-metoxy-1,4-benzoquinol methylase